MKFEEFCDKITGDALERIKEAYKKTLRKN